MDMQNVSNLVISEGEVRTIHDKDNRLLWSKTAYSIKYAGDTFQQSYSGKNLLLPSPKSSASNGLTASYDATTGVITLSGTATATWSNAFNDVAVNLPAGTYTFSATTESDIGRNIILFNGSTKILQKALLAAATSVECVVPQAITSLRLWLSPTNGTNYTGKTFKAQFEVGSQATSFEPYVGGVPAPNPDYPQAVQTVTGEQTIMVTGKNLLNPDTFVKNYYISATGVPTRDGTSHYSAVIPVADGNTYVFSGIGAPSGMGDKRVHGYDSNGNWVQQLGVASNIGANVPYSVTVTIPNGITGVRVSTLKLDTNVQFELGSTATAYELYQGHSYTIDLGSIELCKIGDYQDYIYKNGDDWYLHKEVRHLSKTVSNMNNTENYPGWTGIQEFSQDLPANTNTSMNVFTDSWDNITGVNLKGSSRGIWGVNNNSNVLFAIRNFFGSTWTQTYWKTSYPNLVIDLYYGIVNTPTDTKITDATLVGQLNAVHEWLTRYGYNATITGNLPIVLRRDSLQ